MLANIRENYILKKIEQEGRVSTSKLAEKLDVSTVTIRNDLNRLEEEGKLIKTHGGAIPLESQPSISDNFLYRQNQNVKEKRAIVKEALKHIKSGQTIMLDASSTCLLLARELEQFERLTVITNGIYSMLAIKDMPNITTVLVGGIVTNNSGSTEGTLGKDILDNLNIDVAFTSSHSISVDTGMADFNFYEVQLKRLMLQKAHKIVALVDSTKFNKGAVSNFVNINDITEVITDNQVLDQDVKEFEDHGIKITVC